MTTRGLPGFLRRSRRSDDYDDDDDEEEEDDDDDEIEKTRGINSNSNIDQQQQQHHHHHQIPMKQEKSTSSRENSYGFVGSGAAAAASSSFSEELKNGRQNNDDINDDDDDDNNNERRRREKLMGTTTATSPTTSTSLNYDSDKTKTAGRSSTMTSVGNNNNNNNDNDDNISGGGGGGGGSLSNINENENEKCSDYDSSNNNHDNNNGNNNDNNNNNKIQRDNNNNNNNTTTTATTATSTTSSTTTNIHNRPTMIMERKYSYRETQFDKIIKADVVQMSELRKLGWNGIPPEHRAMAWKIMLGYLPTNKQRRTSTLDRKRAEYKDTIRQHYDIPDDSRTIQEQETLRQVLVDVPRTAPEIPLFRNERIKRALGRLLYIWAIRHPASSYVQGINDLATPLFCVFLSDYYNGQDVQDGNVMVVISDERLQEVEADVYWCLTNILAGIQDHYTADQPGVQRMVMRLEELVRRIDSNLCEHFASTGIQFMQFAFKWMNCLLLREFNLNCVIRLWDTYISEDQNGSSSGGFENFHVYVCAAFLCQFSQPLQGMGFDELFGFMQEVPTDDWGETEIEMLLSQAYVLSTLFGGSDAHLNSNS